MPDNPLALMAAEGILFSVDRCELQWFFMGFVYCLSGQCTCKLRRTLWRAVERCLVGCA